MAYTSRLDRDLPPKTLSMQFFIYLARPWMMLIHEPIVSLTSLYVAIIYGILYMLFAAIPIVFQETRGWSQGSSGLLFIGVAIGVFFAFFAAATDNRRYVRICKQAEASGQAVAPEARLTAAMAGSIILPLGLFLFAWTTFKSVHWIAPALGATMFSCGLVMVFISLLSYLVDSCMSIRRQESRCINAGC
jgi:hypothetical protein